MAKPSGSTRCRRQPVLAARRMTLPVFGGISGATRTMLNTAFLAPLRVAGTRRSRPHPDLDRRRARPLEDAGDLCRGDAGRHHVVDDRGVTAGELGAPARL